MSAKEHSFGSLARLNDRELEVLHLLAAGHTAKTIAVQLGSSETSINERLRTARRKTGVGSSRELARLLDVQKTCDNNIGLSKQSIAVNRLMQPAIAGSRGSKGLIVMLIVIPIAASLLFVSAAP